VRLIELSLESFRNVAEARLGFGDFNLIVGQNAQGKTNLLEAILVMATTKSHRASNDEELLRRGDANFYLGGTVENTVVRRRVEISYVAGGRKQVRVDGKVCAKFSTLIGLVKVVFFSPESLTLVKGSPGDRRRFLDALVSQVRPDYLATLQDYQNALRQRNETLKQVRDGSTPAALLEVWDEPCVAAGAALTRMRAIVCDELLPILRRQHNYLTNHGETADLLYAPSVPILEPDGATQDYFRKRLHEELRGDIARGTTSTGPHRDEVALTVNGADARRFASQGQQRTLALALKLSELEWIRNAADETPLLLLDDVTSELDETRTRLLFAALRASPPQVFLTTTRRDADLYASFSPTVWEVSSGTVKREAG
jgi:DNA replication and repair protein RecF